MKYTNYSLFSTEYRTLGLNKALDRTLFLGFDSVEHIENAAPENATFKLGSLADAKEMRCELDARGLGVGCYSLGLSLLLDNVDAQMERAYRDIEYAQIIGSPFFHHTVIQSYDPATRIYTLDEAFERIADKLECVAKRCNEYGMTCLYEPQGIYFNGVHGVKKILTEMKARGLDVGVCGDTANSLYVDCMPIEIYKAFSDDIKHIHLKDYSYARGDKGKLSLKGEYINYVRMGEGDSDIAGCLALVPDYDGSLSFEIAPPDAELIYSREYIRELVTR